MNDMNYQLLFSSFPCYRDWGMSSVRDLLRRRFLTQPLLTFRDIGTRLLVRAAIGILFQEVGKTLKGCLVVSVPKVKVPHIKFMLSEVGKALLDVIIGLHGILIMRERPDQPLKLMEGLD